jgi:hypothetical protein
VSKIQPSRSQVPVDERSVLATVPGAPWWAVIAILTAFTIVGALTAGANAGSQMGIASIGVGAARNRALFTAMVQPPLLIFAAVPLHGWLGLPDKSNTSRIVFDVIKPLIDLFPWMFWITAVTCVIGIARLVLYRRATAAARTAAKGRPAQTAEPARPSLLERIKERRAENEAAKAKARKERTKAQAAERALAASRRAEAAQPIRAKGTATAALAGAVTVGRDNSGSRDTSGRDTATRKPGPRKPASRPEAAPQTSRNRVIRPDRPVEPRRTRPAAARDYEDDRRRAPAERDDRYADRGPRPDDVRVRGDRPRPIGDRPGERAGAGRPQGARPLTDRDRPGHAEVHRRAAEREREGLRTTARDADPRRESPRRRPEDRRDERPNDRRPRPTERDYAREARDAARAQADRDAARIGQRGAARRASDERGSLPRISGGSRQLPDLPNVRDYSGDGAPSESRRRPHRYGEYQPPPIRREPDEGPPREIRRHRYKD